MHSIENDPGALRVKDERRNFYFNLKFFLQRVIFRDIMKMCFTKLSVRIIQSNKFKRENFLTFIVSVSLSRKCLIWKIAIYPTGWTCKWTTWAESVGKKILLIVSMHLRSKSISLCSEKKWKNSNKMDYLHQFLPMPEDKTRWKYSFCILLCQSFQLISIHIFSFILYGFLIFL